MFNICTGTEHSSPTMQIKRSEIYQAIIGFGGAMTDATAINIDLMNNEVLEDQLIGSYFGDEGNFMPYNCVSKINKII